MGRRCAAAAVDHVNPPRSASRAIFSPLPLGCDETVRNPSKRARRNRSHFGMLAIGHHLALRGYGHLHGFHQLVRIQHFVNEELMDHTFHQDECSFTTGEMLNQLGRHIRTVTFRRLAAAGAVFTHPVCSLLAAGMRCARTHISRTGLLIGIQQGTSPLHEQFQ
jgi:hypothetical protein